MFFIVNRVISTCFFQLIDTQEHHPLSFSPLMQPSLELCYNYLFTSQGQGEFQEKGQIAFTYETISLIMF